MDWQTTLGRIRAGENLHTEFKLRIDHPDDLAAELVAFANTDGGQVYIGVADDGAVTGVGEPEALARLIDNVAYNNCDPPITILLEVVEAPSGQQVLVVNVPKGAQRPYSTNRGVHFIRTSSGRRRASRE